MTPHDQHFKVLLITFFSEFMEAFVPEIASVMDARQCEFLDKELIWIRRRLRKSKFVDLVAKVKLKGEPGFILVHIEHQAQNRRDISQRMFLYAAGLIERYGLPVWPVLLTSYTQPRQVAPDCYEMTVRGRRIILFNYELVQLNRLNWRDYLKLPNPAATALMVRMNIAPADRVRVKSEILRLLLTMRLRPEKADLILGFVETYLELTAKEELKLQRQIDTLTEEDQEKIMKMLLPGERAGLRKGRQEGRQEGRQQMLREDVLDILEERFNDVPYALREKIQEIQAEPRLKKLLLQAVRVPSLDAFAKELS